MTGVTFEWKNDTVLIKSFSGSCLYTIRFAKAAYHEGADVIVISNTGQKTRYKPNGTRWFS